MIPPSERPSGLSLRKEKEEVSARTAGAEGYETLSSGLEFNAYYIKHQAEEKKEIDKGLRQILPISGRGAPEKNEIGPEEIGEPGDGPGTSVEDLELDERNSLSRNKIETTNNGTHSGFPGKPKETGLVQSPQKITKFDPGDDEPASDSQVFFRETVEVIKAIEKNVQVEIEAAAEDNREWFNVCNRLEQCLSIR